MKIPSQRRGLRTHNTHTQLQRGARTHAEAAFENQDDAHACAVTNRLRIQGQPMTPDTVADSAERKREREEAHVEGSKRARQGECCQG